jgi:hypothetical protein
MPRRGRAQFRSPGQASDHVRASSRELLRSTRPTSDLCPAEVPIHDKIILLRDSATAGLRPCTLQQRCGSSETPATRAARRRRCMSPRPGASAQARLPERATSTGFAGVVAADRAAGMARRTRWPDWAGARGRPAKRPALSLLRRSRQIFRHIEAPEAADVAAELSDLGRQYRGGAATGPPENGQAAPEVS